MPGPNDDAPLDASFDVEHLRLVLRAGRVAAWEWNGEGDVWTSELYELLGLPRDAVASTPLFMSRVHPDDRPALQRDWERATRGIAPYDTEFRIVLDDGSVRWLRGVGEVVRDEAGGVQRILGWNWDVTKERAILHEREALLRELQDASSAKTRFLAMMSHEVRSPLTAVLGYTRLLRDREDDPSKLDHLLRIERNGKYLLELLDDILDMSWIEEGRLELEIRRVDVRELVEEVIALSAEAAADRGLGLSMAAGALDPGHVDTDALRLRQILHNLVSNAVKFTEEGSICVHVQVEGAAVRFDVADTGVGIALETVPLLFEPFRQADETVHRRFGGTGLGLSIARQLARLLGGELGVESELGAGSTFTLRLPLRHPDAQADVPIRQRSPITPSRRHLAPRWPARLLIVDDRPDNRDIVAEMVRSAGYHAITADGTERALALVRGVPPVHLVLLDLHMPGRDGFAAARELRAADYLGPLVAITADALPSTAERALSEGFAAVLHKPIRPGDLFGVLDRELARLVRILVVDDDDDVAFLMQASLDARAFVTARASTAAEALELARTLVPDVILSDLRLPDLDGRSLAKKLRAIRGLERVRLVATSGDADRTRSLKAGFDEHLVKPVELPDLLAAIVASGESS